MPTVIEELLKNFVTGVSKVSQPAVDLATTTGQAVSKGAEQINNAGVQSNPMNLLQMLFSQTQQPQQEQPKTAFQHLVENAGPLGIKSISHDEKGGGKVEFNQPDLNTIQGLGTTGNFQSQEGQTNTNVKQVANTNQPNNNPTIRSLPQGPLGMFYPGSDTEQPGGMYKLLTLLAGAGGYKPSTETAQNAEILQKMLGQTPMTQGEREKALNEMISTLPTQLTDSQKAAAASIKPLMESRSIGQKVTGQRTPEVIVTRQQLGKAPSATVSSLQAKMERISQISDQLIQKDIAKDGGFQSTPNGNKYRLLQNKKVNK